MQPYSTLKTFLTLNFYFKLFCLSNVRCLSLSCKDRQFIVNTTFVKRQNGKWMWWSTGWLHWWRWQANCRCHYSWAVDSTIHFELEQFLKPYLYSYLNSYRSWCGQFPKQPSNIWATKCKNKPTAKAGLWASMESLLNDSGDSEGWNRNIAL